MASYKIYFFGFLLQKPPVKISKWTLIIAKCNVKGGFSQNSGFCGSKMGVWNSPLVEQFHFYRRWKAWCFFRCTMPHAKTLSFYKQLQQLSSNKSVGDDVAAIAGSDTILAHTQFVGDGDTACGTTSTG